MTTYKRVSGDYVVQTINPTDIVQIESVTTVITGDLSVSGNATLLGNISGDRLFNGTSNVEIAVASGNVTIGVGGSGIATYATTGQYINGIESVSGNITGGNLNTAGQVSATANITGGNVISVGNIIVSQNGTATTNPIIRFTDSNTAVTTLGSNIGAVEWYTNDATGAGPRVAAAIKAVYGDSNGNANILIQTGNTSTPATAIAIVGTTGNIGMAGNVAPNHNLAVQGTIYSSSTFTAVGNITGGNVTTAGLITATGNITSGNVNTAGLITATGNITGGNVISLGAVSAGAGGVSATGNITGGNVNSLGILSVTSNIIGGNVISATTLSASANITGANISVGNLTITGSSNGTGIGVENIVWQSTDTTVSSASMANIGVLSFNALANQVYKFEVLMPTIPDGGTTTAFSMNFPSGTCQYLVEAQTTPTSVFNVSSSNTSDSSGATQAMTGATLRTVRITGTFTNTANTTVAVRGQTSAANLTVKGGSYLTYTRTG